MKCDVARTYFMDYIYEELEGDTGTAFEAHIRACDVCRREIAELRQTRGLLQALPQADPGQALVFAQPRRTLAEWWKDFVAVLPRPLWARVGLAGMVCAMLLLLAGSLANFRLMYANQTLSIRMSLLPPPQAATEEMQETLLARMRAENAQLVSDLLAAHEAEEQQKLARTLARFASDIERRRENDLRLIGRGLEEIHQTTNLQFGETNEMLKQLFRQASFEQR